MQNGRRRRAPAVARAKRAPGLFPDRLAIHIENKHAEIAEVGVYAFAVGGRCLGGVGILQMVGASRNAAMYFTFPYDLARSPVDRIDHPAMLVRRNVFAIPAKVETLLRRFGRHRADD